MLSNVVAFYGCMALFFMSGVNTDINIPATVENCRERIDECKNIGTTDEEIVRRQMDIAECFTSFTCKDSEDDARIKDMLELARRISMADEEFSSSKINPKPSNLAWTFSISYKTLIFIAVTGLLLA